MCAFFCSLTADAQKTGFINRQATIAAGRTILDPNGDGYTSATTAGFGTSDVANSEIPYTSIPSFSAEPFGDLRRGPNHLYSDFVPDAGNNGVYLYYNGTQLLFRFRLGSVMSGSKGYSVMIDTDNKFGSSGANADPNYLPATTGVNGNPGFEIEVVLETNFRIAIYNVDGTSTPTLVKAYTNWQDMSQISLAGTNDNGDPDFFIDFYIPFSDLQAAPFNLTTSTPLRMSATTVMSPGPAIGGPKSDIYGLSDNNYKNTNDEYEAYINAQPAIQIGTVNTGFGPICTAAPVLTSVNMSAGTVSGTWTKSSLSGAAGTATISVYKNGTLAGTVPGISSGATWNLGSLTINSGDVITAKAVASGESTCLVSNSITASNCTSATRPALPVLTCAGNYNKGVSGSNLSTGWTVTVENMTRGTVETPVSAPAQFTTSGTSPSITWNYAGGCNGGPNMPSGSYKIYYVNAAGCASEPVYFCLATGSGTANNLAGTSATPVITAPVSLTPGTTSISGTGEPNASVTLYVDGTATQTVTASAGGVFTFSNLSLVNGQQVYITNVLSTGTVSTSKCFATSSTYTVNCYSTPPVISVDNNNQTAAGGPITGAATAGSTVRVYTSANTLVATTTALADGSWSTANASTTPAAYNAVASTIYYATAQSGTCSVSANSANATAASATSVNRCGTISGSVSASATSVSGLLTGSFSTTTVNLYLDGVNIGSTSTSTASWGPITVNSTINNTLYANGVLSIGVQESGKQEVSCPASPTTISCSSAPAAPVVSPTNYSTPQNQQVTYTISNAVAGYFYGISDATTGKSLATGVWATSNGNLSITTDAFNSSGTYNVVVKAVSLSGLNVCTSTPASATVSVSPVLPVSFLDVSAVKAQDGVAVSWSVTNEQHVAYYVVERSTDCVHFTDAGRVNDAASSSAIIRYSFNDAIQVLNKICYRIRQVDIDGRAHYSSIVTVQGDQLRGMTIAPNPAKASAVLYVGSAADQVATLSMSDMNGREVLVRKVQLRKGDNAVTIEGLSGFARGTFFIKVVTSDNSFRQKLILQ